MRCNLTLAFYEQVHPGLQPRGKVQTRMQKSVCWALMHRRDDQLRHADNDCKNSVIIQGTPQIKGLLLFKAAAGFTDNQEQLLL